MNMVISQDINFILVNIR